MIELNFINSYNIMIWIIECFLRLDKIYKLLIKVIIFKQDLFNFDRFFL